MIKLCVISTSKISTCLKMKIISSNLYFSGHKSVESLLNYHPTATLQQKEDLAYSLQTRQRRAALSDISATASHGDRRTNPEVIQNDRPGPSVQNNLPGPYEAPKYV